MIDRVTDSVALGLIGATEIQRGINLYDAIEQAARTGPRRGIQKQYTIRPLAYNYAFLDAEDVEVSIIDAQEERFCLVGHYDPSDRQAWFDLQTRGDPDRYPYLTPDGHHPDLQASQFLRYYLDYLARGGMTVDTLLAKWYQYSTNFQQFQHWKKAGYSDIAAVLKTWTSRQFTILGFRYVESISKKIDYETGEPKIEVVFRPIRKPGVKIVASSANPDVS